MGTSETVVFEGEPVRMVSCREKTNLDQQVKRQRFEYTCAKPNQVKDEWECEDQARLRPDDSCVSNCFQTRRIEILFWVLQERKALEVMDKRT